MDFAWRYVISLFHPNRSKSVPSSLVHLETGASTPGKEGLDLHTKLKTDGTAWSPNLAEYHKWSACCDHRT